MVFFEQWQWMAAALIAVTLAGTLRSVTLMWIAVAATVVASLVWYEPALPAMQQLMIFAVLTLAGMVVSEFAITPKTKAAGEDDGPTVKAMDPSRVVGRSFTLSEPIVNGFGQIEIDGATWRIRGEDAPTGETVRVLGVDGLERDLLIVTKEEEE